MTSLSLNHEWGFWGTVAKHEPRLEAEVLFTLAVGIIIGTFTDVPSEDAVAFLDSKWGRHFADEVLSEMARVPYAADAMRRVVLRRKTRIHAALLQWAAAGK